MHDGPRMAGASLAALVLTACFIQSPLRSAPGLRTLVAVHYSPPRNLSIDTPGGPTAVAAATELQGVVGGRNGDTVLLVISTVYTQGDSARMPVGTVQRVQWSDPGLVIRRMHERPASILAQVGILGFLSFPITALVTGHAPRWLW